MCFGPALIESCDELLWHAADQLCSERHELHRRCAAANRSPFLPLGPVLDRLSSALSEHLLKSSGIPDPRQLDLPFDVCVVRSSVRLSLYMTKTFRLHICRAH